MLIKVFSVLNFLLGVLEDRRRRGEWGRGRGGGGATGLLNKEGQQAICLVAKRAVEFPEVLASGMVR